MPFFEVVGFTSTWMNFNVASAFLRCEKEDNYVWVVGVIAELCRRVGKTPKVIVTDKEVALINAIGKVFPEAKHILCRRHAYKNIDSHAKKQLKDVVLAEKFAQECMQVFWSKTEYGYKCSLDRLQHKWSHKPKLVNYVKKEWLSNYKVSIVSAWTDKVMHLGTTTTNR